MSIDWGAVTGAASAIASVVAVAGIVLAYKGVRISRDASGLDRRNYLDGIFVRWLDSVDALDHAALPFLRHVPTQAELDAGTADPPDAYSAFHLAFRHCQTATNLLDSTGMFDHKTKDARQGEIATEDLIAVFNGVLWTYYFSVIRYSPTEAANYEENHGLLQGWRSAVQEVESELSNHQVPDKYFPVFEAMIRKLYPESSPLSVWQASDRLLDVCKAQVTNRYFVVVRSRFPWDHRG